MKYIEKFSSQLWKIKFVELCENNKENVLEKAAVVDWNKCGTSLPGRFSCIKKNISIHFRSVYI